MRQMFVLSIFLAFFLFISKTALAATFGLIGPTEQLTRGQEVTFTITIDTQEESLNTTRIGLQYDTNYLQFLNAIPGDTFSSISVEEIETGKLVLTGTNDSPFSGKGTFAYVKFKLIAENPGSTQLCSFFNPETSPTPTPQPQASPTATPMPTSPSKPAIPYRQTPTSLPKSGNNQKGKIVTVAALFFISLPIVGFTYLKLKP